MLGRTEGDLVYARSGVVYAMVGETSTKATRHCRAVINVLEVPPRGTRPR